MSILEIIAGALLILAGIAIILVVLLQESKQQGMSSAIQGGANDSFYQHNSGRTKEARLEKITKGCAVAFFLVALAVNIVALF